MELAQLDRRNGFGVRAMTRIRAAVATLPPVTHASPESLDWSNNLDASLDAVHAQLDEAATASGIRIAGLEWAIERARGLLALPGVPPAGSSQGLDFTTTPHTSGELRARSADYLAGFADVARDAVAFADMRASFERGNQAAAGGATGTAERWYDDAMAKAEALPGAAPWRVFIWAARDRFEEAQAALRAVLDAPEPSTYLLGSAAAEAQDYETALRLFAREPDTERPWDELLDHAEAALGAGEIELAMTVTERAVADFEERFSRLRRDVDRVAVSDSWRVASLYLLAARAQLARAQQLETGADSDWAATAWARGFARRDRARALTLSALLADASEDTDDERLILAWRQATTEWQAAYDRLYRAYITSASEEDVRDRVAGLASAEEQLVEVEAELEEVKRKTRAPTVRREPAALEDVQRALQPDAALVEYELFNRDLLVWTVTRHSATAVTSRHGAGAIARLAKAVQNGCANGQPGPEAAELAEILLAPVASVADACRRLIIVPYGPLHGLPFHVLPLAGSPLGETHVVSYLPAAALLQAVTVDAPFASGRPLVVGDPAFDAATAPLLARLPGAAVEATSVAGTCGVRPLIGPDATEQSIRRDLASADLVHLAAHGRLDPIAPSDSSIVLAGRDELTVSDLVGLRIDAELAVLSACDSGRGAASLGGDVVGLARGLIAAGVRRSVVSLWPVDDAPACVTMSLFHEHLAGGVAAAEALHTAQQAVRRMSGDDIATRYVELGGHPSETAATRRRGASSVDPAPSLPLDPEFVDDLADDEPVDVLSGELARVWAPFVVIGV
jgi:CHAT domain-containing protein